MKKYSKTEQRERSKRLEYFEGLFLSVLAFENKTGKNDEFSYWTETEKFGKLIIYPKGDKLLITRSGEWKSGAVEWLKENVIIEKSVL